MVCPNLLSIKEYNNCILKLCFVHLRKNAKIIFISCYSDQEKLNERIEITSKKFNQGKLQKNKECRFVHDYQIESKFSISCF